VRILSCGDHDDNIFSRFFAGREAVLSLNRQEISFTDCLVGNVYHEIMEVINAGDIEYPIQLSVTYSHELQSQITELDQQERRIEEEMIMCGRGKTRRRSTVRRSSVGEALALPLLNNKVTVGNNCKSEMGFILVLTYHFLALSLSFFNV
jgi:hypothetical protein